MTCHITQSAQKWLDESNALKGQEWRWVDSGQNTVSAKIMGYNIPKRRYMSPPYLKASF
jgi:hypothetical protein